MCLISTFSGPDSGGTVEGNDHLGSALIYFDSVKHYPGAASRANGGTTLTLDRKVSLLSHDGADHVGCHGSWGTVCLEQHFA